LQTTLVFTIDFLTTFVLSNVLAKYTHMRMMVLNCSAGLQSLIAVTVHNMKKKTLQAGADLCRAYHF
jgi:hypothetical protein